MKARNPSNDPNDGNDDLGGCNRKRALEEIQQSIIKYVPIDEEA